MYKNNRNNEYISQSIVEPYGTLFIRNVFQAKSNAKKGNAEKGNAEWDASKFIF